MTGISSRARALLPKGQFARSVTLLAGGSAAGQLLIVLASPILTRLYSPSDFGALTVYSSILSVIAISAWCYEFAIPLADDDTTAVNLVAVAVGLVLVSTAVFALVLAFLGSSLLALVNGEVLVPYLWLLPVGMLGMGLFDVFRYWAIREKDFGTIARTKVLQGAALVSLQIGSAVIAPGPAGLIVGDIGGRAGGLGRLLRGFWSGRHELLTEVSRERMGRAAARFKRFPLFITSSIVINNAGLYLPPLMFAAFYGRAVAGWFGLSHRVLTLPVALVGQAVAQVFYGELSRAAREERSALQPTFDRTTRRLLLLGIPPAVVLFTAGEWLFGFVFGDTWGEAGIYAQILAVMLLAQFVSSPLSQTLVILELQTWQVGWDVFRLVLTVGAVIGAEAEGMSPRGAVAAYGAAMTFAYVVHWLLSYIAIRRLKPT